MNSKIKNPSTLEPVPGRRAHSVGSSILTGAQLLDLLRSNAQRLIRPEELLSVNKPDLSGFISRGYLHFSSSLRYTIRLGKSPKEATVESVTLHGKDLTKLLDQKFKVAFSRYIGGGLEGWKGYCCSVTLDRIGRRVLELFHAS